MSKFVGVGTKGVGQAYDGPQFKKWDDWEVDESVTGKYIGLTEKPDKYGKHGFIVGKENGDQVSLNSTGLLAKKMVHVSEGDEIQVTYKGKSKITKGKWAGSMAHNIKLAVAGVEATESDDDDI